MASFNQIPHNHLWLLFFRIILKLYNTKIPNTFSGLLSVLSWCKPQLNLQFCHHFSLISNSTHTFSCFHIQNIDTFNENVPCRTCSVQADCCGDPRGPVTTRSLCWNQQWFYSTVEFGFKLGLQHNVDEQEIKFYTRLLSRMRSSRIGLAVVSILLSLHNLGFFWKILSVMF